MAQDPSEPANLVLEHLRIIRAEANATRAETNLRFDSIDARFDKIEADIAGIRKDIKGFKLNVIAEVYKANLTVSSVAGHHRRIEALERKLR